MRVHDGYYYDGHSSVERQAATKPLVARNKLPDDSFMGMLVGMVDVLSFGAFSGEKLELREPASDFRSLVVQESDERARVDHGVRRFSTHKNFARANKKNKGQLDGSQDPSGFAAFMDAVAFPEKHLFCGKNTLSSSRKSSDAAQSQSFNKVMDCIAFPEEHLSCANNFDSDEHNASRVACSLPSPGIGGTFEKVMDCVAFPERQLNCAQSDDNQSLQTGQNQVLDAAIIPENHIAIPTLVSYKRGGKKSPFTDNKGKAKQKYLSSKDRDLMDEVFENAEAQCCNSRSALMKRTLQSKGDVLDFACSNMEDVLCRDDTYHFEDFRADVQADTYIQRNNSLIDNDASPVAGDVLMVRGRPIQKSMLQQETIRKTFAILNAADERELTNCSSYECSQESVVESKDQGRDWTSVSSGSSSISSLSSVSHIQTRRRAQYAINDGMELVLAPKQQEQVQSKKKPKNLLSGYLAARSARRLAKKAKLSKRSRSVLAEDEP